MFRLTERSLTDVPLAHKGRMRSGREGWRRSGLSLKKTTKDAHPALRHQPEEILQQLQANLLAFLRMKLRGEHVVLPDRRGKCFAVGRARGHEGFVRWFGEKTVHEINVTAAGNAAKQRAFRLHDFDLVPADLRNFQPRLFGKANDFAAENPQPSSAALKLLAPFKQRLIADANAKKRAPGLDEVTTTLQQLLPSQRFQAIIERANTRQHDGARVLHFTRLRHEPHVSLEIAQSLVHAAQVARPVVNQSNHARSIG